MKQKKKNTTNKTNKEQLDETKDTGNGKKVLQNIAQIQTQSARENAGKENTEQAQIMETINKKERNMKQQTNPNTEEYEIIEEKKPVKDVKEQSTNYQQLPEVTMTKQNDINITISSKGKTTTRSQITERRLGATK